MPLALKLFCLYLPGVKSDIGKLKKGPNFRKRLENGTYSPKGNR